MRKPIIGSDNTATAQRPDFGFYDRVSGNRGRDLSLSPDGGYEFAASDGLWDGGAWS